MPIKFVCHFIAFKKMEVRISKSLRTMKENSTTTVQRQSETVGHKINFYPEIMILRYYQKKKNVCIIKNIFEEWGKSQFISG